MGNRDRAHMPGFFFFWTIELLFFYHFSFLPSTILVFYIKKIAGILKKINNVFLYNII